MQIEFESKHGYEITKVVFINSKLAELIKVPHCGDWFSGNDNAEYKEALVSLDLKNEYEKGKTYIINNEKGDDAERGDTLKIKVIGYLGKDNHSLQLGSSYMQLFSDNEDIMVCDSANIDIAKTSMFITNEKSAKFYNDYNGADIFKATVYKDLYEQYKEQTKEPRYYVNYLTAIIVALIVVCIVANSVFKVETDIKRNMLKYVVGMSNKNIILSEVVKSAGIFLIPLVLVIIATPIVGAIMKNNSSRNIITWENLFISAGIILAIYATSTVFGLVRVIRAKPLDELRKE